jgi:hypothetical protein
MVQSAWAPGRDWGAGAPGTQYVGQDAQTAPTTASWPALDRCLRRLSLSSHLAVAEWVTVMMAEVAMKIDHRSALHTLMRTLSDAELHDLLVMVQTELLNRRAGVAGSQ